MKELVIKTENILGIISRITELLGKNGINIETIVIESSERDAMIKIVTSDTITTKKLLYEQGFLPEEKEIVVVEIPDKPNEFSKVTKLLETNGIVINSAYLLKKENGNAYIALTTNDMVKTKSLLRKFIV